jgi:hypothetical protein
MNADGGLTINVQANTPEGDKEANWLPRLSEGEWFTILRAYLPRPEVIEAEWECLPLKRIK